MKKNGFTLLELLAVIVVLAIIALIVTPFVTKAIEEAKINQYATSSNNLADIVTDNCAKELFTSNNCNSAYAFQGDNKSQEIKMKGTIPDKGIVFTDGKNSMFYTVKNDGQCSYKMMNGTTQVGKMIDGVCVVADKTNYNHNDDAVGLSGTGTVNDPYQISSIEDLVDLSLNINNYVTDQYSKNLNVVLNASLDFENENSYLDSTTTTFGDINGNGSVEPLMIELTTGKGFKPIMIEFAVHFSFDGKNNIIKNLYENTTSDYTGLFGQIYMRNDNDTLIIKNLNITDANLTSSSSLIGTLVGEIYYGTLEIKNINISTDITISSTRAGGLIGSINSIKNITIENILCQGKIEATQDAFTNNVAGILGNNSSSNSTQKYSNIIGAVKVSIDEGNYVGGLLSTSRNNEVITNLANFGDVTKSLTNYSATGGVLGYVSSGKPSLANVYNFGQISGYSYIGGIIGQANGNITITNSNNYGEIIGRDSVGGIIGCSYEGIVSNSNNYGKINSMTYVGGIIGLGQATVTITDSNNYGNIIVKDIGNSSNCYQVGGIAGTARTVTNCNNYGNVTASCSNNNRQINAIVGDINITATNCNNYGTVTVPN